VTAFHPVAEHESGVAALDLGKAVLEAGVRVPHAWRPGRRTQEVPHFATIAYALLEMAGWFHRREVTRVVMEPTCDCVNGAY
jgi:transposase